MQDQDLTENESDTQGKKSPSIKEEPQEEQLQHQLDQLSASSSSIVVDDIPPSPRNHLKDHHQCLKDNRDHQDPDGDDCPQTKRQKRDIDHVLVSLKSMDPGDLLEVWNRMISQFPPDLEQLRSFRTAIDNRIKFDIISHVPYEIALYITSFLNPKDLCQAAQTCRSWRIVCEDSRTWREKCDEEGLLSDEQTLSTLFKKRISTRNCKQEKFVSSLVPPEAVESKSEWKTAYMKHVNILRNWKIRNFDIKEPFIAPKPKTDLQLELPDRLCVDGDQNEPHPSHEPKRPHLMQLRCHEDSVITCLQYNPLTSTIVSGSDDQTLKVWSSETGRCLTTLEGHTGGVWSSQLSPDDIVISGATDRTLRIWRAHTGELIHTCIGHASTVRCLALDGDKVVSGSRDQSLRLWDIKDGNCLQVFSGHSAAVRCVEYKNGIIVSGAYDHLVMVWDANTGCCFHALECHISRIYSLQFDGKTIASGSLDSTICIWDAETGKLRHHLEGHTSLTSKMQLKGNLLVSANADSYCKVWDVNTGQCLQTLGGEFKHTSAITSVYFNNRHVVTSSDDGTVKLWEIKTGKFIRNLITLPTASNGGVVWRIKASYTKLICAVGSRTQTEDTHLLVLDFNE